MTSRIEPFTPLGGAPLADRTFVFCNSGPIPNRAYRTGEVGVEVEISAVFIMGQLFTHAQVPVICGAMPCPSGTPLPPILVDAAACAALVLLGDAAATVHARLASVATRVSRSTQLPAPTRGSVDIAIARLETLHSALRARGLLTPFHGVVRGNHHDHVRAPFQFPWLGAQADDQGLTLAWGLVAIACASPPILLFSRQPTLACFRSFSQITLRWLGTHPSTSAAARVTA